MTANGDVPESLEEINLKMNATTDEPSSIDALRTGQLQQLAHTHLATPVSGSHWFCGRHLCDDM
ncbi:unnamed protein product [Gongylonema pulchrum]|uniref:Uncharacterized protein n=1 Tax=Gongylonema pulchrum TaxID=637853 RepID=A0A183E703_9BILA|nr:unnamed protein product [Gongylonema pulchrum]